MFKRDWVIICTDTMTHNIFVGTKYRLYMNAHYYAKSANLNTPAHLQFNVVLASQL